MAYKRQDLTGFTPQDLKKLNDNLRYIWLKVNGDINFDDWSKDTQDKFNSVPRYLVEYIGGVGAAPGEIEFTQDRFSPEAWELITTRQDVKPIFCNYTPGPALGYDYVTTYRLDNYYDPDRNSFIVVVEVTSGKYVNGVPETVNDGFLQFDMYFLIKEN